MPLLLTTAELKLSEFFKLTFLKTIKCVDGRFFWPAVVIIHYYVHEITIA